MSRFHKAVTSSENAQSVHLSTSGQGGIGGEFLGASVSGRYDRDVLDNKDVNPSVFTFTVYTS